MRQRWRRWLARRGAGVDRCRDPQAILGVAVGDTFTGSYTYDVNTPDMQPDPTVGTYPLTMPNEGMQIVINTITYETDPAASPIDFTLEVANRPQASNGDSFGIQSNTNRSSGPRHIETMFWALEDPTGAALSTDALPTDPPVLADWSQGLGLRILACATNPSPSDCSSEPSHATLAGVVDTVGP